jgi:hypothetical protein
MCATTAVLRLAPPAAASFYSPDRVGEHPASHMAAFTGLFDADGYAGFDALYKPGRSRPDPITEVACWAHCRRGFGLGLAALVSSPSLRVCMVRLTTARAA